jgi:Na+/phosphate symporter
MREFVQEVESLLEVMRNLTQTIREIVKYLYRGEPIETEPLDTLFETFYKLEAKALQIHRIWVIEPYMLTGELKYETVQEIILKIRDFVKEYEKVIMEFTRASDDEKIKMLKSLTQSINKYTSEIEALLIKLEEEVREE